MSKKMSKIGFLKEELLKNSFLQKLVCFWQHTINFILVVTLLEELFLSIKPERVQQQFQEFRWDLYD